MKEKTYVEDVDRNMYDFRNDEKDAYRIKNGLTEDIVEKISEEKHDPEWMHDFRLNSLKIYHEMKVPDWGPSIEWLNMDNIATYVRANTKMKGDWSEVPEEIKDTFEKLGIPQAERTSLAGVGAVRLRARLPQCPQGGCGAGCYLHRYGKCSDRRGCRYGKGPLYEARDTP